MIALTDAQGGPISGERPSLRFRPTEGVAGTPVEAIGTSLAGESGAGKALYAVRATFDAEGKWVVAATVPGRGIAETTFFVLTKGYAPRVGQSVPLSKNLTLRDVPVEQLTSQRPVRDEDFYRMTVEEAVQAGKPFMVVFGTPAFCQTQTCGPVLEEAQALKRVHGAWMNFIHVEVFKRPDLLLAGEVRPEVMPAVREWNLQTDPWVFLVGADGKVFDRFEGYASGAEMEEAIGRLLASG
jgi:thiol-disulfide isomerase/thioredoxin